MKTYIVFDIQGYDVYNQQKDEIIGVINIKVISSTEENALKKAKKHHPKKLLFRCIGSTEYNIKE